MTNIDPEIEMIVVSNKSRLTKDVSKSLKNKLDDLEMKYFISWLRIIREKEQSQQKGYYKF